MAIPNGLNPNVAMISFGAGSAVITGGTSNSHATILTELGGTNVVGPGSIYISSATGMIFVQQGGTWSQLTIN